MSNEELNVEEAIEFFKAKGGESYEEDPEKSKQAQGINKKLQNKLKSQLDDDNEVELHTKGSKWNIQGQTTISDGIWYRAYYKEFGANLPVVFGVYLGRGSNEDRKGLNFAIQIYTPSLNDNKELLTKLGEIIEEVCKKYENQDDELKFTDRCNDKEPYKDFGYFGSGEWNDTKLTNILKIYKEVVKKINEEIFKQMIDKYKSLCSKQTSSKHCQINANDEHYTKRKKIKDLVDKFIENPTEENFKAFWSKDRINSVQQGAQAVNVIRENGSIKQLKERIKSLIDLKAESNENIENDIKNQIKNAKNSALEFYYYYHMNKDDFPLINGGIKNAIKIIEDNKIEHPDIILK